MAYSSMVLLCSLLLFLGAGLLPRFKSAILLGRDDSGSVDTFNGRTKLWGDVSDYIGKRPLLLGYGYAGFWTPDRVSAISELENQGVPNSHSTYIDYLLTLGVVGLAAYVLLLLAAIKCAFGFHRMSRNPAFAFCGAVLVFCLCDGFLESEMTVGGLLMYLCLVVIARLAFFPPPAKLTVQQNIRSVALMR
jgi:O-antigen ligase